MNKGKTEGAVKHGNKEIVNSMERSETSYLWSLNQICDDVVKGSMA